MICQKDYFLQIVCLIIMLNKSHIFLPGSSSQTECRAEEHLGERWRDGLSWSWCMKRHEMKENTNKPKNLNH